MDAHTPDDDVSTARTQLTRATVICVFFMLAEVVGGYMAGSLAIMTDAAHLMSDVAGFLVSLFCLWLTQRKSTAVLSFGFKRAEVLGALLSVSMIWVVTGILVYEATLRTRMILYDDPAYQPVNGRFMFFVACLGLICNLIILKVLGHSHSHDFGGHGDLHDCGGKAKKKVSSKRSLAKTNPDEEMESLVNHGHSHENGDHTHSHAHADSHTPHSKVSKGGNDHGHSHDDHGHSHNDHGHAHATKHTVEEEDDHHHDYEGHASHDEHSSHGDTRASSSSGEPNPREFVEEHEMNGLSIRVSMSGLQDDEESGYGTIAKDSSPALNASHGAHAHEQNINVSAAYVHALGDFLQSIGVIIAGALIWAFPGKTHPRMQLVDPMATFVFSLFVLWTTWQILKTSVHVLMEGVPVGLDAARIKRSIDRIPGVCKSHDLHVWSLSIGNPFLSVHIMLEKEANGEEVLQNVHKCLRSKFGIRHSTVQVESSEADCESKADCHEYDEM